MKGCLRYAKEDDMDLLFEWVNEAMVRKNSFSTQEISYEEHKKWYQQLLSNMNCMQYIYMYDTEAVGQVRLFVHGEKAEITYSICAAKRGMGHGKNILQLLCNQVKIDFPEVKRLVAKVKPDNIASQRAFLDNGYEQVYNVYEIMVGASKEKYLLDK